jgi:glycerol-3-phosphate dehydrogenase
MRRDPASLTREPYDLLVIGGGIFGIFAAWDAALRGLSVAIIERRDWAHAASENCFKIVHGGIRYLQHGDLVRVRQSSRERNILLRIAPHQVRPLPILVPTYGHGRSGKEILALGVRMYEAATWDRNRGIRDPLRKLPPARVLSAAQTLDLYPDLPASGLTGGVIFHDARMHSPARLALCVLRSAVDAGAHAANYVAATGFLRSGNRVEGVLARDEETGEALEIRARYVLNAAGAWSEPLLEAGGIPAAPSRSTFSRDAYFILPRRIGPDVALAVKGSTRDPDAILSRDARHLFLVPRGDCTLVGVWHVVYPGRPDEVAFPSRDLHAFLDEINEAFPALRASPGEVARTHHGLVLFGSNEGADTNLRYGHRSRIIDHEREQGIRGLMTLIGVRYTTARHEAERALDRILEGLGRKAPRGRTAGTPLRGGAIPDVRSFVDGAAAAKPPGIGERALQGLLWAHGTEYGEVIRVAGERPDWTETLPGTDVLAAEVVHATRIEMARRLADVWFRRTELGAGSFPGPDALQRAADLMGGERGWTEDRRAREMAEVREALPQEERMPAPWN